LKIENSTKKAPFEVFQQTIKYFPTVSINIILRNDEKEFLFVKRKNNPAKGLFWTPGGRILNGETMKIAAQRILKEETGLRGSIHYLSPVYLEEIFDTSDFDAEDQKIYLPEIKTIHYLSTAILMELEKTEEIKLDFQSVAYKWQKELPHQDPYLRAYFDLVKDYLQ